MSDSSWTNDGKHPPASSLLLYLERELSNREYASIERHLAECWECRSELEHLQRGICGFVEYRTKVLLPEVPPRPGAHNRFERRVHVELAAPVSRTSLLRRALRRLARPHSMAMVATAAAVIAAVMIAPKTLSPRIAGPPSVSAAVFLAQVRTSSGRQFRPDSRSVIYQRVEIRHGSQLLRHEIVRAANGKALTGAAPSLPQIAPVDWSDPLNAASFAVWHDNLGGKADSIEEAAGSLTLKTTPSQPGRIRSASLTVRQSDWHALGKSVSLENGDAVEIREIAYEVRPEPSHAAPAHEATQSEDSHPAVTGDNQNELQLEVREIALREAMHRIGADVHEAPRIWREGRALHINAWVESEARAEQIRVAAAEFPDVKASIYGPGTHIDDQKQTLSESASEPAAVTETHVTQPPLTEQLWKKLGGMDPANRYLAEFGSEYTELLAAASALDRLAERYPEPVCSTLPPDVRTRLGALATDQVDAVRTAAVKYDGLLAPILKEMSGREDIVPLTEQTTASCGAWQALAPAVVAETLSVQRSFHRLFVAEQVDRPIGIPAEAMLQQAVTLRGRLVEHVRQLCGAGKDR